ncbi:MAG: hypothetical protein IPK14_13150 [Blastocatellia bacterium]|nr:hypothetical protein [Blastocatellia bacterium]MBL8196766.1 hypothetical protein [Blastocatellia bacterium]MBN8725926.1 hypothetical protein [Acidobacteriota bacterium]
MEKKQTKNFLSIIIIYWKSSLAMPANHIFYNQLIEYFWHLSKEIIFTFLELIIFLIVLVDILLGLATIIYTANSQAPLSALCWIAISFFNWQLLQVLKSHRLQAKFSKWLKAKLIIASILGIFVGITIWPVFDLEFGKFVGAVFGCLLAITTIVVTSIISLELRQKK